MQLCCKLNEGQQKLKGLSDQYMKLVNQTPHPEALKPDTPEEAPIPTQ